MRQYIKNNGNLVEDIYELPHMVADNNIPTDKGMEIDSFDGIYYKNPSTTWITSKGVMDSDAEVGDIIWFYKAQTLDDNWLACNGLTFDTSKYPKLYEILGSNTLPSLAGSEPIHLRGAGNNSNFSGGHITLALKETNGSNMGAHSHTVTGFGHWHEVNEGTHYHNANTLSGTAAAYGYATETINVKSSGSTGTNTSYAKIPAEPTIGSSTIPVTVGTPIQVSGGPTINVATNFSAGNIRAIWGVWYIRAK